MVAKRPLYRSDWHAASDQPRRVSDERLKRELRWVAIPEYARTLATLATVGPLIAWRFCDMPTESRRVIAPGDFIGLGVTPGSAARKDLIDLVAELGVRRLLLRLPVWHLARLDEYAAFIAAFPRCEFMVTVMQDRTAVLTPERWQDDLRRIFTALPTVREFQIGQAPNRMKWGCLHLGEYFDLAERAHELRAEFPRLILAGPGLIDFEPLVMVRSLMTARRFRFDAVAAALYVDRRGAPGNKQYGIFDLSAKIRLQSAIASLSPRLRVPDRQRLWITETNWPLAGTGDAAPTSPAECVNEDEYADYLRAYFQQAYATGLVERVYWWQLVAAGYGLVDPRGGTLRKRSGFHVLRKLLSGETELGYSGSRRLSLA